MPWNTVPCHPTVATHVRRSLEAGRFSPSTLIYGPPGAGQELVAVAAAQSLLCETVAADFCGTCSICRRVEEGIHPDVFHLHPRGVTYHIEQIREIQEMAVHYPYESARRIFILHESHRMNPESANCLLKTLEEPYEHNVFLLLTDTITALLPTILSRCRKIRLLSMPIETLVEHYQTTLPPARALTLARLAGGLPVTAQQWLDAGLFEQREEWIERLKALKEHEANVSRLVEPLAQDKTALENHLVILLGLLRDGVLFTSGLQAAPFLHADLLDAYATLWPPNRSEPLLACFEQTLDALEGLRRYLNMNIVLTDLLTAIRNALA